MPGNNHKLENYLMKYQTLGKSQFNKKLQDGKENPNTMRLPTHGNTESSRNKGGVLITDQGINRSSVREDSLQVPKLDPNYE
mmetsp:Transcript_2231/g.3373  ORF Transcript_2231/g.3373 Transcript_2231/m.3373 type:complete len:82 (+) Transcript_2231:7569-7814(+)